MMTGIKKVGGIGLMLSLILSLIAGCGGGNQTTRSADAAGQPNQSQAESKQSFSEPVTVSLFNSGATVWPEDQFKTYIHEPVAKKYPHITINYINGALKDLQSMVSVGNIPDIVTSGPSSLPDFMNLALVEDMTPLVKKHNLDLNRIQDQAVSFIRNHSRDGSLYSIPVTSDSNMTIYNKDIFDKFGVPYPKDYMTFDDYYELTKKIAREEGGVKYRGIDFQWNTYTVYNQKGLSFVDSKTEKSNVNTDPWKALIAPLQKIYAVSGNEYKSTSADNDFLKNKNLAMYVTYNIIMLLGNADNKNLNWDLTTMPIFSPQQRVGSAPFPQHMLVTAQSKNKDAAFLVIETVLTDEVQAKRGEFAGIGTVLKSQSVKDQFMKGVDFAKGKNVAAFYKLEPGSSRVISRYYKDAQATFNTASKAIFSGKKDMNTALREAQEQGDKRIEEAKASGK
jgi:multiple sugar transport system substrate-binding protein